MTYAAHVHAGRRYALAARRAYPLDFIYRRLFGHDQAGSISRSTSSSISRPF
jgi:hypothetical protein